MTTTITRYVVRTDDGYITGKSRGSWAHTEGPARQASIWVRRADAERVARQFNAKLSRLYRRPPTARAVAVDAVLPA